VLVGIDHNGTIFAYSEREKKKSQWFATTEISKQFDNAKTDISAQHARGRGGVGEREVHEGTRQSHEKVYLRAIS
jgi:hypothetical protein